MFWKIGRSILGLIAFGCIASSVDAEGGDVKAPSPQTTTPAMSENMKLVGYNDLQGRSAYQPIIHRQGNRLLLYVGHHPGSALNPLTGKIEPNGTSVIDVTDPARPKFLVHIPITPADWPTDSDQSVRTGAQHAQICDGDVLPNGEKGKVYLLRNQGNYANELVDVTDPINYRVITQIETVQKTNHPRFSYRTHKNFWDCKSGVAFLPSSRSDWSPLKVLRIFDLSNPSRPKFIRTFGLRGMQPGAGGTERGGGEGVHEAAVYGNRVSITYGTFDHGVVQIVDFKKLINGNPEAADPMAPTAENLGFPVISELDLPSFWGAHSAKPLLRVPIADYAPDKEGKVRDFLVVTSEGGLYPCDVTRHATFFVDITDEMHPFPVSNFQVPAEQKEFNFCSRGPFGPHAPNASNAFGNRIMGLSYFSAGLRVVDIRNPFSPVEIAYYIPASNAKTGLPYSMSPIPADYVRVPFTNNVEIDDRGFFYMVDRSNTGLHIVSLTGNAAAIAGRPDR